MKLPKRLRELLVDVARQMGNGTKGPCICPRVQARLACKKCEYPPGEAFDAGKDDTTPHVGIIVSEGRY